VFYGFGTVASGPFPALETVSATNTASSTRRDEAIALLEKAGWKINPDTGVREKTTKGVTQKIFLSLSTSNVPELVQTARIVEEAWKSIGVGVDVRIFETSDLNQNVIRPRKYDALLFGTVTGRNPDLYAFWHSSQRNDPGLNIALYTNSKADSILENIRTEKDKDKRIALYESFNQEIKKDLPALFLYSPQFIYSIPDSIKNIKLEAITTPSDRFSNIYQWYIETDNVWTFFSQEYYIREGSEMLEPLEDSVTNI
jgi:peptide/nickel transport system substrate-binding protein